MSTPTHPHIVLRAICMEGERVEVDGIVHLTKTQGTELAAAGKVRRMSDDEAAAMVVKAKGKAKAAQAADKPAGE